MPLHKRSSLAESGPNKHRSSNPSVGSENTDAVKPVDIVVGLPANNPTSEPLPLPAPGVATTNEIPVAPTESYLDGIKGPKGSDDATASKHVDVANDVNVVSLEHPVRELETSKPEKKEEEEEQKPMTRIEKLLRAMEETERQNLQQAKETLINKHLFRHEQPEPRVLPKPSQYFCGGKEIPRSILVKPSVPPHAAPFTVSAYGQYVPDGPHTSSSEDTESESGDDDGTGDDDVNV